MFASNPQNCKHSTKMDSAVTQAKTATQAIAKRASAIQIVLSIQIFRNKFLVLVALKIVIVKASNAMAGNALNIQAILDLKNSSLIEL